MGPAQPLPRMHGRACAPVALRSGPGSPGRAPVPESAARLCPSRSISFRGHFPNWSGVSGSGQRTPPPPHPNDSWAHPAPRAHRDLSPWSGVRAGGPCPHQRAAGTGVPRALAKVLLPKAGRHAPNFSPAIPQPSVLILETPAGRSSGRAAFAELGSRRLSLGVQAPCYVQAYTGRARPHRVDASFRLVLSLHRFRMRSALGRGGTAGCGFVLCGRGSSCSGLWAPRWPGGSRRRRCCR